MDPEGYDIGVMMPKEPDAIKKAADEWIDASLQEDVPATVLKWREDMAAAITEPGKYTFTSIAEKIGKPKSGFANDQIRACIRVEPVIGNIHYLITKDGRIICAFAEP